MGLFSKKNKVGKDIYGGIWGYMVNQAHIDVDTLSRDIKCVDREGKLQDGQRVTFVRVFKPAEATAKGVQVEGWETFDKNPELVLFEGYLTMANVAHIEAKNGYKKA